MSHYHKDGASNVLWGTRSQIKAVAIVEIYENDIELEQR